MADLQKCKSEIRAVRATKSNGTRSDACVLNDDFRRKSGLSIDYITENKSKLDCLLAGDRDESPSDLGRVFFREKILVTDLYLGHLTFFQFLGSGRGANLMDMLSLGGQPSPKMWNHFEEWWLTTRMAWNDKVNGRA